MRDYRIANSTVYEDDNGKIVKIVFDNCNDNLFNMNNSVLHLTNLLNAGKSENDEDTETLIPNNLEGNDAVDDLHRKGVYDSVDLNWETRFARTGILDPFNKLTSSREFLFFTKPDLNLLSEDSYIDQTFSNIKVNPDILSSSSFLSDVIPRYPTVVAQLVFSKCSGMFNTPFMAILSNAVTNTLDLPGITADTIETSENIYGTSITYRGTSYKSDINSSFSLDFRDNRFLEIYMLFKIYDEYERLKWKGFVRPPSNDYIYNKVLHDQISIYKFIVAEDGYTLLYWAKATGCFPTNVPRDSFSKIDEELTYSIDWNCHFVSDMDPSILVDFRNTVKPYVKGRTNTFLNLTRDDGIFQPSFACFPYIDIKSYYKDDSSIWKREKENTKEKFQKYYLRWIDTF